MSSKPTTDPYKDTDGSIPEEPLKTIVLPVYEEQLLVSKQRVDTGKGVRIEKTVIEKPQNINEILYHEHVEINRVAVDRVLPAGDKPTNRYDGDTLIIPVVEEVLVVEKRLRLKEELHITKNIRKENQVETLLVKSEEVSIERFDENAVLGK